jgi:hypothetical protein
MPAASHSPTPYFRKDENEARQANVLTWDEARRIASNIAKLEACSSSLILQVELAGICGSASVYVDGHTPLPAPRAVAAS